MRIGVRTFLEEALVVQNADGVDQQGAALHNTRSRWRHAQFLIALALSDPAARPRL